VIFYESEAQKKESTNQHGVIKGFQSYIGLSGLLKQFNEGAHEKDGINNIANIKCGSYQY
jgi:hypothetical protein